MERLSCHSPCPSEFHPLLFPRCLPFLGLACCSGLTVPPTMMRGFSFTIWVRAWHCLHCLVPPLPFLSGTISEVLVCSLSSQLLWEPPRAGLGLPAPFLWHQGSQDVSDREKCCFPVWSVPLSHTPAAAWGTSSLSAPPEQPRAPLVPAGDHTGTASSDTRAAGQTASCAVACVGCGPGLGSPAVCGGGWPYLLQGVPVKMQ